MPADANGLGRARLGQSSGVEKGDPPRIQGQVSPGSQHQDVTVSHTALSEFGARRELTPFLARPRGAVDASYPIAVRFARAGERQQTPLA